jgi:hypothetical protein
MHRNALAATDFFRIPPNRVIELGSHRAARGFSSDRRRFVPASRFLGSRSASLTEAHAGASAIFFDEFDAGLFEGFPQLHDCSLLCG